MRTINDVAPSNRITQSATHWRLGIAQELECDEIKRRRLEEKEPMTKEEFKEAVLREQRQR